MHTPFASRPLGRTGLDVGPLGLGSSYGLPAADVERAFERGVRFFLWGSRRRGGFGEGLRNVARRHREDTVIAIQSYTRVGALMPWSVDRALRALKTDYVDVLGLAWWNGPVPQRIVDAALRLREQGKIRHVMISGHHRPTFERFIADPAIDLLMFRYNAAHPGAEREIFPSLPSRRAATIAFTATRWGTLLDPRFLPEGERAPRATDCYRFALTNPNVDVCLSGPKDAHELDAALAAVDEGPMDEAELAWMRRVGAAVRASTVTKSQISALEVIDKLASFSFCGSKQLTSG
jgi:aryl-alcohol dehydrogenase-like predicted oxidoreductase